VGATKIKKPSALLDSACPASALESPGPTARIPSRTDTQAHLPEFRSERSQLERARSLSSALSASTCLPCLAASPSRRCQALLWTDRVAGAGGRGNGPRVSIHRICTAAVDVHARSLPPSLPPSSLAPSLPPPSHPPLLDVSFSNRTHPRALSAEQHLSSLHLSTPSFPSKTHSSSNRPNTHHEPDPDAGRPTQRSRPEAAQAQASPTRSQPDDSPTKTTRRRRRSRRRRRRRRRLHHHCHELAAAHLRDG